MSSQSSQPQQQQPIMTPEERKEQLAKCLLSQYRFATVGVVGGAGYSLLNKKSSKPGPWPMLAGGFVGTLGDFIYGYFVECAHLRESDAIFEIKDKP